MSEGVCLCEKTGPRGPILWFTLFIFLLFFLYNNNDNNNIINNNITSCVEWVKWVNVKHTARNPNSFQTFNISRKTSRK